MVVDPIELIGLGNCGVDRKAQLQSNRAKILFKVMFGAVIKWKVTQDGSSDLFANAANRR